MPDLTSTIAFAIPLHPMIVHFPIALWVVALLFWLIGTLRRRDDLFSIGRWLLYLAGVGALAAATTGFLAANAVGHDTPGHELVHEHRNLMITATILGLLTAAAAFALRRRKEQLYRWLLVLGLVATVVVTAFGAFRGGALVYDHGIGTQPARAGAHARSDAHDHDHLH